MSSNPDDRRFADLPGTPIIATRSLDEAVQLQSTINSPVRADRGARRKPFEWRASRTLVGPIAVVSSHYRNGVHGHAVHIDRQYALMIPLGAGGEVEHAGSQTTIAAGRQGAVLSPGTGASFVLGENYRGLQVSIPRAVMHASYEAYVGEPLNRPLRFGLDLDLTRGAGADVSRLVRTLVESAADPRSLLQHDAVSARLADALVHTVFIGLPHAGRPTLAPQRAGHEPHAVGRAEAFLRANLDRQVTAAELATVVGLPLRTLFAAFRAHRGVAPMAFHRALRFERARTLLQTTSASVTDIALECGFEHLGRFSVEYRARFGQRPSETRAGAARSG